MRGSGNTTVIPGEGISPREGDPEPIEKIRDSLPFAFGSAGNDSVAVTYLNGSA
jgi:hypothetical protein